MRYVLHKLFGFEYAIFEFGFSSEIRRIRTAKDGSRYCICYGTCVMEGKRGWMQIY